MNLRPMLYRNLLRNIISRSDLVNAYSLTVILRLLCYKTGSRDGKYNTKAFKNQDVNDTIILLKKNPKKHAGQNFENKLLFSLPSSWNTSLITRDETRFMLCLTDPNM